MSLENKKIIANQNADKASINMLRDLSLAGINASQAGEKIRNMLINTKTMKIFDKNCKLVGVGGFIVKDEEFVIGSIEISE